MDGTFQGHLVLPPCHEQGHLPLDQVAQSPVQPGLECFQGSGISHLSGQPAPVPHHAHCKQCLPSISCLAFAIMYCTGQAASQDTHNSLSAGYPFHPPTLNPIFCRALTKEIRQRVPRSLWRQRGAHGLLENKPLLTTAKGGLA